MTTWCIAFVAAVMPVVGMHTCAECKGSGKIVLTEPDYGQHAGRIGSQPKKKIDCPLCGGKGRWECYRDPSQVRLELMRARETNLETLGEPCLACNWSGLEACKSCKGAGVCVCDQEGCKGGWIVTRTTKVTQRTKSGSNGSWRGSSSASRRTSTRKETKINVAECPRCRGVGKVRCPECGGRKASPCRKCGGTGIDPRKIRQLKENGK